jgi:hypothetical protein
MKTPSQASYASRLARAQQLHQFISSFQDFNPGIPELTAVGLENFIAQLNGTQAGHTSTHFAYAEAAKARKKVFATNDYSISKSVTRINAYLKAKKGKDSQQYIAINTLLNKIRGERVVTINKESTLESISRTEKSYGSQLQNFMDILTLLTEYGGDYAPSNTSIHVSQLEVLKGEATTVNNAVTITYSAYKPKINERQEYFRQLSDTANRIKEMVKSQYGTNSVEYTMIKGLNFTAKA